MAEVRSSSDTSNIVPTGNKDSGENTQTYLDSQAALQAQEERRAQSQLPGTERDDGAINWFGSSYTGVDIKVVAHLYTPIETDAETERLRKQYDLNIQLADACANLLGSLNPVTVIGWFGTGGEDRFLQSCGLWPLTEQNGVAATHMLGLLNSSPRTTTESFIQIVRARAMSNEQIYGELALNLESKIKAREQIKEKSTSTLTLATLQTLSIQTHREKFPVRSLGASYVKGYTRGPRTIAGSMIFTLFNENALSQLIRGLSGKGMQYGEMDTEISTLITDQLPPIDLTIVFANEYGSLSQMGIYGVEFVNDGMTLSIEDLLTEQVVQFVARDADIMTSKGNIRLSRMQRGMHFNDDGTQDTNATSLLISGREKYNEYLGKLKVRRRLLNR